MAVQYGEAVAALSSPAFRSDAEVDLLRDKVFKPEAAHLPEGISPAKYEGARSPAEESGQPIPKTDQKGQRERNLLHLQHTSASHHPSISDAVHNIVDQRRFRPGVGIDEKQPISCSGARSGIAHPGNLAYGLKYDTSTDPRCQLGGTVSGAVVHDNNLSLVALPNSREQSLLNTRKRAYDELFFIVGRDDYRESHGKGEGVLLVIDSDRGES